MCFLKHIFGYTALHKTVDRLNLRLEWYVYVNTTTRSLRGKKLDKLRGIDSHEAPPWLAPTGKFSVSIVDRRKWVFSTSFLRPFD